MKRLIVAFVMIIIIIGLTVTSANIIDKYCDTILTLINKSEIAFKDGESTDVYLDDIEDIWENAEPLLYIFTNHESIEEIGVSISMVRAGDEEDFLKESAQLKEKVSHLSISEKLSLRSFF
ncbi:MAG: DUF4363 family protein [Ruminococcaceae bacterium]|nr:DUF4363 family protein [Oscillospiraceae bacterium]